ncbi:hypothetical protein [Microcoleus sp. N9_A1]
MLLVPTAEPIPLVADANGVIRVSRTRVTIDTLITRKNWFKASP